MPRILYHPALRLFMLVIIALATLAGELALAPAVLPSRIIVALAGTHANDQAELQHAEDTVAGAAETWRCASHDCGCRSAADCRIRCCCFGPASESDALTTADGALNHNLHWRAPTCSPTSLKAVVILRANWLLQTPPTLPMDPFFVTQAARVDEHESLPLAIDSPPPRLQQA